jgi:hypothetical protein
MDPRALNELIPDWQEKGAPLDTAVTGGPLRHPSPRRAASSGAERCLLPGCFPQPRQLHRQPGQRCAAGWRSRPKRSAWKSIPGFAGAEVLYDDKGRCRKGRGHRRHGHRPRRPAHGCPPAGHGTAGQVHPFRRRLPRPSRQAARGEVRPAHRAPTRRSTASASRNCGRSKPEQHDQGPGDAHRRLADAAGHLRRRLRLSLRTRTWSRSAYVVGLAYKQPLPLALRGIPALQDCIRRSPPCPRGRQAHRLRRARA